MNIAIGNTSLHTSAPYSTSDVRSGKNEFGGMLSALRSEDDLRELTDKQIEDMASSGSSDSFEAKYKDYLDKFVKDSELYEHFFAYSEKRSPVSAILMWSKRWNFANGRKNTVRG